MHQGRAISEIRQDSENDKKTHGDVLIWGLWDRRVNDIIDVNIGDTDAYRYKYKPTTAILDRWEKIKKDKHVQHCHDQWKHFLPFVLSVDNT